MGRPSQDTNTSLDESFTTVARTSVSSEDSSPPAFAVQAHLQSQQRQDEMRGRLEQALLAWTSESEEQLTGGSEASPNELHELVWTLAQSPHGTHVLQEVIKSSGRSAQRALAQGLHGRVDEAWRSKHANWVLQECINSMFSTDVEFIVEEIKANESTIEAAKHEYGCRVLQRLFEQSLHNRESRCIDLACIIVGCTAELTCHEFGNHVLQSILDRADQHRQHLRDELVNHLLALGSEGLCDVAKAGKGQAYVLQKAMRFCTEGDELKKLMALLEDSRKELKDTKWGSFVMKAVRKRQSMEDMSSEAATPSPSATSPPAGFGTLASNPT